MADPLARDEDRQLHVQLELAHLERRRVAVTHQVADEPAVAVHRARAFAVRHARRLDDGAVVAHVVDESDEPVIEAVDGFEHPLFEGGNGRAAGRLGLRALRVDGGAIFGRELHAPP